MLGGGADHEVAASLLKRELYTDVIIVVNLEMLSHVSVGRCEVSVMLYVC